MRWAGDERRLALACQAVLEYMQRQPIAATWGRADLASSDMMSLETSRRVWQARRASAVSFLKVVPASIFRSISREGRQGRRAQK